MIILKDIIKQYKNKPALYNVNLHIRPGEFVFLTGPSGAGKSTLMKMLYMEERPTRGQILVGGINIANLHPNKIPNLRRCMGIVFQDFKLLQNHTVYDNIAYVIRTLGISSREIDARVYGALKVVGLESKAKSKPTELSGGEQQRVSVARALAKRPRVLFLDEPTGALDEQTGRQVLDYICKLQKKYDFTIVMVTHNLNIAEMANTVVKMNSGKIFEIYTNETQKTAYEIGW